MEIYKIKSGKIKEISCKDFIKLVEKNKFSISNHYLSPFGDELLIIGYIKTSRIQLFISSIEQIVVNTD